MRERKWEKWRRAFGCCCRCSHCCWCRWRPGRTTSWRITARCTASRTCHRVGCASPRRSSAPSTPTSAPSRRYTAVCAVTAASNGECITHVYCSDCVYLCTGRFWRIGARVKGKSTRRAHAERATFWEKRGGALFFAGSAVSCQGVTWKSSVPAIPFFLQRKW